MNLWLLISLILIVLLYIVVLSFTFVFYLNAKAKFYTKMKVKPITYFLIAFVFALFIAFAILVSISTSDDLVKKNLYIIPLCWVLASLTIVHLFFLIFSQIFVNKSKKNLANFREEDFKFLLTELQKNKPTDLWIEKFKKHHKQYCSILEQRTLIINNELDNYKSEMYERVLTDIVLFNDLYTSRTGKKSNYLQLEMFYKMCIKLQKK